MVGYEPKLRVMCVLIVIALLTGSILITPQVSSGAGSDVQEPSTWVDHIVISEVLTECEGTEDHEFVELYNPTDSDISLIGWDILYDSTAFDVWNIKYTISESDANGGYISAHGFYLIGEEDGDANDVFNYYGIHVDNTANPGINLGLWTNSHIGIRDDTDTLIDRVGYGTATWPENTTVPQPPTEDSVERRSGLTHDENNGNGWDTDHNLNDFIQRSIPEPQNSTSTLEGVGVDTDSPELIYAASTGLTTIEAHFSEPVNTSDVENITNWKIVTHSNLDTNPPYVLDCKATTSTNVEITLSEAVNIIDANDIKNYQIDGGVSVTGAILDAGLAMINLTTTAHPVNITHTLTINWINDTASPSNVIAHNTEAIFNGGDGRGLMKVVFIDVEQGDATLIISPTGEAMLVDGGDTGAGAHILDVLAAHGLSELKYTVATHYHADHIGGLDEVINGLGGSTQITNASYDRGDTYESQAFTDYVDATGSKRKTIEKWDVLDLGGGVTATCVGVNGNGLSVSNENDLGVVLRVDYYDFQMYLAGDLGGYNDGGYDDVESTVANDVGQVEVYQVDHHGSEYSSNPYFLSVLAPTISVFSVGNNGYGHVTAAAYDRVNNQSSYIYYTNAGSNVLPGAGEGDIVDGDINLT
ncbi:MAG: lamin tail domain-containing protein, partial [Thermoplasmata archaeon]|nr:lamin tail domain-containing protein [Thermoplasmata archaeon]